MYQVLLALAQNVSQEEFDENDPCLLSIVGSISVQFQFFSALLASFSFLVLFFSVLWWIKHRNNVYLKVRPFTSLVLTCLGFGCSIFSSPLHSALATSENFITRCESNWFFSSAGVMFIFSSHFVRLLTFHRNLRLSDLAVKAFAQYEMDKPSVLRRAPDDTSLSEGTHKADAPKRSNHRLSLVDAGLGGYGIAMNAIEKLMLRYRYSTSKETGLRSGLFSGVITVLICIFGAYIRCPNFNKRLPCNSDLNLGIGLGLVIISIFGTLCVVLVISSKTKKYPDPYGFLREVKVALIISAVSTATLGPIIFLVPPIREDGLILLDFGFLIDVSLMIIFIYLVPYQVHLSKKLNDDIVELTLLQILEHPSGARLFKQHLLNEYSAPNLAFWRATKEWKDNYNQTSQDARKVQADNIVRRFLLDESSLQVSVSYYCKESVIKVMQEDDRYPVDLFEEISLEIFRLMENDSFLRFRMSSAYAIYTGLDDDSVKALRQRSESLSI